MVVKLSISLNEELAELVRREAKRTGRTVSDIFKDAIKAYQKERIRQSYIKFTKSKVAKKLIKDIEEAQSDVWRKLG